MRFKVLLLTSVLFGLSNTASAFYYNCSQIAGIPKPMHNKEIRLAKEQAIFVDIFGKVWHLDCHLDDSKKGYLEYR